MTKAEIVEALRERVGGFSKREASQLVDCIFETIKDSLTQGDVVRIAGFGNLSVREKAARMGRNPQTKEHLLIDARRILSFRPSKELRQALNPDQDVSVESESDDDFEEPGELDEDQV